LEEEERERHKLDRQILREEHWVRYGVTARRKRNVRRMADLAALRQKRREARGPQGGVKLEAADADLSGTQVIEAEKISLSFGEKIIVKDFSTRILRGDRIGLVGANGAGKTTLLNLLMGKLEPDQGRIRRGTNLAMTTLEQKRDSLDPTMSLADTLSGGSGDRIVVNGENRHVVSYMKDFLFSPEQARTCRHAFGLVNAHGFCLLLPSLIRQISWCLMSPPMISILKRLTFSKRCLPIIKAR